MSVEQTTGQQLALTGSGVSPGLSVNERIHRVLQQLNSRNQSPINLSASSGKPLGQETPEDETKGQIQSGKAAGNVLTEPQAENLHPKKVILQKVNYEKASAAGTTAMDLPVSSSEQLVSPAGSGAPSSVASTSSVSSTQQSHSVEAARSADGSTGGPEIFRCAQCDYCSHNKHYLKQHVDLVHSAERPFKCPFCDYAGKRSHSLKEHLVVHSNNRPYECGFCNATFRKKGHLTNHIKMHNTQAAQKTFTCGLCKAAFPEKSQMLAHIRSSHQTHSDCYACDMCEYVTLNKSNILMHMHTHCNPKTFMCSVCKFTTVHVKVMEEHMLGHNGFGSYKEVVTNSEKTPLILLGCSECGFTTFDKETLKSHMWSHLSKNLPEEMKDKSFEEVVGAKTDPESQNQGKDCQAIYKCSSCNFISQEAGTFISHMLTQHKPVEPGTAGKDGQPEVNSVSGQYTHDQAGGFYRCVVCGYTSEHQRTIKAHMWRHSGNHSIDYPMFQNGPLSIYEDTPIGQTQPLGTKSVEMVRSPSNVPIQIIVQEANQRVKTTDAVQTSSSPVVTTGKITIVRGTASEQATDGKSRDCQLGEKSEGVVVSQASPSKSSVGKLPQPRVLKLDEVKNLELLPKDTEDTNGDTFRLNSQSTAGGVLGRDEGTVCTSQVGQGDAALVETTRRSSSSEAGSTTSELLMKVQQPEDDNIETKEELLDDDIAMTVTIGENTRETGECVKEEEVVIEQQNITICDIPVAAQCTVVSSQDDTQNSRSDLDNSFSNNDGFGGSDSASSEGESSSDCRSLSKDAFTVSKEIVKFLVNARSKGMSLNNEELTMASDLFKQLGINKLPDSLMSQLKKASINVSESTQVNMKEPGQQKKRKAEDDWSDHEQASKRTCENVNVLVESMPVPYPTLKFSVNDSRPNSPRVSEGPSASSSKNPSPVHEKGAPSFPEVGIRRKTGQRNHDVDHTDEAITLLSLLKKGPNLNPACPPSTHKQRPAKVNHRPKSGISSSLLAVIEQLRERSKSESDPEEGTSEGSTSGGRPSRRRRKKKADSDDDGTPIENLENVEILAGNKETLYRCKLCHYSSNSPAFMKAHIKLIHKTKKPFECSLCDYVAESTEDLQSHTLRHCKARTYQCKSCASSFGYKSQLRAHMRIHTDIISSDNSGRKEGSPKQDAVRYRCSHCQEGFSTKAHYSAHSAKCKKANTYYVCQVCGYKALNEYQFIEHAKSEHMSQEEKYKCEQCDFHSTSEYEVTEHKKTHETEQNLVCDMCGFTAISMRSLKSHMKRHTNDQRFVQQPLEQYKCNLCGYLCHHLPSLKSHMWRHASDSSYSYEVTNNIINSAMDNELRSPSVEDSAALESIGAKPTTTEEEQKKAPPFQNLITFRCCQCGFETGYKHVLNSHMSEHTDIIQKTQEINRGKVRIITKQEPKDVAE